MSGAIKTQGFTLKIGDETDLVADLVEIKEITNYSAFDGQAAEIDTTYLQSDAKEFIMGLQDFGGFNIDVNHLPSDAGQIQARAAKASAVVKQFLATNSDGSTSTFFGYVLSNPQSGGVDAKVDASFSFRITGDVLFATIDNPLGAPAITTEAILPTDKTYAPGESWTITAPIVTGNPNPDIEYQYQVDSGAGFVNFGGATATLPTSAPSGAGDVKLLYTVSNGVNPAATGESNEVATQQAGVLLSTPDSEFDQFNLGVSRVGSGTASTFTTNYSYEAARAALSPVNTFYVDKATGDNNNAGTDVAPFRSIDLAVKMALDTGVLCAVKVKGDVAGNARVKYSSRATQARSGQATNNATWSDAWNTTYTDVQVIIEPWNEGELFENIIEVAPASSWTATSDSNIWKNSGANVQMVDYSNLDNKNAPRKLYEITLTNGTSEADAIAAVNAAYTLTSGLTDASGTNYAIGVGCRVTSTQSYIRLFDNRDPNGDTDFLTYSVSNGPQIRAATKDPIGFFVGMTFIGGGAGAFYCLGDSGFRPQITAANCAFIGGIGAGAFTAAGDGNSDGADTMMFNCSANGGQKDGFNYHENCKFVEIDCAANWNGWNTNLTNNGSTCHDSCDGIRINGVYLNSQDRAMHDVGNINSWNLNCVVSTRRGEDASVQSAVWAAGLEGVNATTKMWLDACSAPNGIAGVPENTSQVNYTNATIFHANLDFTPEIGPSSTPGTLTAYTP